jgi:hypothetical protein
MPRVFVGEATRQWAHNLDDLRDRWAIRREAATETDWMPAVLFEQTCATLDDAALMQLRAGVVEIHHAVKARLAILSADRRKRGQYADPDTWNEIESARAATGRHLVIVNDMIGRRRRAAHRESNNRLQERFIAAAKRRLTKELFAELMAEAEANRQQVAGVGGA